MLSYDAMRQRKPHSVTCCLGSKEGNEDALQVGSGNSFPCICDLNYRPTLLLRRRTDLNATITLTRWNRLSRVSHQVEQRLPQHALVRANHDSFPRRIGRTDDRQFNFECFVERFELGRALLNQFIQVYLVQLQRLRASEVQERGDHISQIAHFV